MGEREQPCPCSPCSGHPQQLFSSASFICSASSLPNSPLAYNHVLQPIPASQHNILWQKLQPSTSGVSTMAKTSGPAERAPGAQRGANSRSCKTSKGVNQDLPAPGWSYSRVNPTGRVELSTFSASSTTSKSCPQPAPTRPPANRSALHHR